MKAYSIKPVSEDSVLVSFNTGHKLATPDDVQNIAYLVDQIKSQFAGSIINLVPAYSTLMIQYDVLKIDSDSLIEFVERNLDEAMSDFNKRDKKITVHTIPVYYAACVAADLVTICESKGMSIEQLIKEHTSQTYSVYALGFKLGFAYLGHVSESLSTPRHSSYKGLVPLGSVGIADRQTAVYPTNSPGGWQIIGRTPMSMMEGDRGLLRVGDHVCFQSIDKASYLELGGKLT